MRLAAVRRAAQRRWSPPPTGRRSRRERPRPGRSVPRSSTRPTTCPRPRRARRRSRSSTPTTIRASRRTSPTTARYYGLPACTTANGCFKKVNQTGGTFYPLKDPGWALEIALDVETAHAICQNCKILLVEATSATLGEPLRRRERGRHARRERDLELVARGRVLGRDGRRRQLQPSRRRDHGVLGRQRLRRRVSRRVALRDRRRRHDARARLRRVLRRRVRVVGQRLRLLRLRAQAGLADGHRLLAPVGRRRVGGRRPEHGRGGLRHRLLLRPDGLVPGRRHEPLLAARRLGLRADRRATAARPRRTRTAGSSTTSRPARTAAARRSTSARASPATTGRPASARRTVSAPSPAAPRRRPTSRSA